MVYQQSEQIKLYLDKANKILVTSHIDPDADNVGSILAFGHVLKKLGKNVVIALEDNIPNNFDFLPGFENIIKQKITSDYLAEFDLVCALDVASWERIFIEDKMIPDSSLNLIVIDHHITNKNFGKINLVVDESSTAEIVYNFIKDCNFELDKEVAECLLTGIIGDTGSFRYIKMSETLIIAKELIDLGADIHVISTNLFSRVSFESARYWGYVLSKLQIEKLGKISYVWCAISYEELSDLGGKSVNNGASQFISIIEDTEFGGLFVEEEKGKIFGSFRSKGNINVSDIAAKLSGGGHKAAAGFRLDIENINFDKGVNIILNTINSSINV